MMLRSCGFFDYTLQFVISYARNDRIHDSSVSTLAYDTWRETPDDSRKDEEYHESLLEEKEEKQEKGSLGATLERGSLGATLASLEGKTDYPQKQEEGVKESTVTAEGRTMSTPVSSQNNDTANSDNTTAIADDASNRNDNTTASIETNTNSQDNSTVTPDTIISNIDSNIAAIENNIASNVDNSSSPADNNTEVENRSAESQENNTVSNDNSTESAYASNVSPDNSTSSIANNVSASDSLSLSSDNATASPTSEDEQSALYKVMTPSPIAGNPYLPDGRDDLLTITEVKRSSPPITPEWKEKTTPTTAPGVIKPASTLEKIIEKEMAESASYNNSSSSSTPSLLAKVLKVEPPTNRSESVETTPPPFSTKSVYETATESYYSLLEKKSSLVPIKDFNRLNTEENQTPVTMNPLVKAMAKQLAVNEIFSNRDIDASKSEIPYSTNNDISIESRNSNSPSSAGIVDDGTVYEEQRIGDLLDVPNPFEDIRNSKRNKIPDTVSYGSSGDDKDSEYEDLMTSSNQFSPATTPPTKLTDDASVVTNQDVVNLYQNLHVQRSPVEFPSNEEAGAQAKQPVPDLDGFKWGNILTPDIRKRDRIARIPVRANRKDKLRYNNKYINLRRVKKRKMAVPKHEPDKHQSPITAIKSYVKKKK